MADTDAERLDRVAIAIEAILTGGQDITYNGRRVTMADLKTLQEYETYLQRKIDRAANGGIRVRRGTPE